jgi:hypothetical protein
VSLAVGATGAIAGVVGGALALDAKKTADLWCDASACFDPRGIDAENRGKLWAGVSTVGFIAGAAGLATGALLLWLTPSTSPTRSALAIQPAAGGGAQVRWFGSF